MSLDGSAQRPQVHAVGPDSDGPPPPARAEGEYLVETIDQPGPLLFPNEPFELRPIRCKLRLPQPMLEKLECLLANFGIHRDGLKSIASLSQCIHGCPLAITECPRDMRRCIRQFVQSVPTKL